MGIKESVSFIEGVYRPLRPGEGAIEFLEGAVTRAADFGGLDIDDALQAQYDLLAGEIGTPAARKVGVELARLVKLAAALQQTGEVAENTDADALTADGIGAGGKYNELLEILAVEDVASTTRVLGKTAVVGDQVFRIDPRNKVVLPAFAKLGVDLEAQRENHVEHIFRAMATLGGVFGKDLPPEHEYLLAYLTGEKWPEIGIGAGISHQTVRHRVYSYLSRLEHLQLAPTQWDELASGIPVDVPDEIKDRILNRNQSRGARRSVVEVPDLDPAEFKPHSGSRVVYLDEIPREALARPLTAKEEKAIPWQQKSLCRQTDPDAHFPDKGGTTREAKKICVGCEVRSECLAYALHNDERFGIWGGLSERERRKLKKRAV